MIAKGKCSAFSLLIISSFILLLLNIFHLISYFFFKITDLNNIIDTYESSPLFNISISDNYDSKAHIVFHVWEGRRTGDMDSPIADITEISKINGRWYATTKKLIMNYYIMVK